MKGLSWLSGVCGAGLLAIVLVFAPLRSGGGCSPCRFVSGEFALVLYALIEASRAPQRCESPSEFTCVEAILDSASDGLGSYCDFVGGVYTALESCPVAGRVGVCRSGDNPNFKRVFYGAGASPWTTASAGIACDSVGGRFEAE